MRLQTHFHYTTHFQNVTAFRKKVYHAKIAAFYVKIASSPRRRFTDQHNNRNISITATMVKLDIM